MATLQNQAKKVKLPVFDGGWWFYDNSSEEERLNAFFIVKAIISALCIIYYASVVSFSLLFKADPPPLSDMSSMLAGNIAQVIILYSFLLWAIGTTRWMWFYASGFQMPQHNHIMSLCSHPFISLINAIIGGIIIVIAVLLGNIAFLVVFGILAFLLGYSASTIALLVVITLIGLAIVMRKRNLRKYEVFSRLSGD